jgi:hypothetical protein
MIKRLIPIILVLLSINAFSQQSQVQAKRGVFTERLFVKDRWIDRITTDLNTGDSTQDNVIPTGKAIADFIRPKAGSYIQDQFSTAQPANLFIQGQAVMGSQNGFRNSLYSGKQAEVNVTQNNNQHGLSVQRSSTDQGPASLVFFKNRGNDFSTLNGLQTGDTIGSLSYSGVAGNNADVVNVMSMHGRVEKAAAGYLSSGFVFNTTDTSGVYRQRVWLNGEGNLLLGNATTNPYRLNVEDGEVRFNGLAGSGDGVVGIDINGKLGKLILSENIFIQDGILNVVNPSPYVQYKKYFAILSQSGQNNPGGYAHERSFDITWTRNSTGNYTGTLIDDSLSTRTVLHAEASDEAGNVFIAQLFKTSPTTVTLIVKNEALNNIDGWTSLSIEIKTYPDN